jgi:hypothetical protein
MNNPSYNMNNPSYNMNNPSNILLLIKQSDYPPLPPLLYRTSHDLIQDKANRLKKLHSINKIYNNCVENLKDIFSNFDKV